MGRVDAEDDSRPRWVLWHYRYDPERRERHNVPVGAWDNEAEFVNTPIVSMIVWNVAEGMRVAMRGNN